MKMKRFFTVLTAALAASATLISLASCGKTAGGDAETTASGSASGSKNSYRIGICNYVDDASLNQISESLQNRLKARGAELGVEFTIDYDNCNADASVMGQIISNFQADKVDLMVGIATPVAMQMQAATEESGTPVVFAAVSDPVSCQLVSSLEAPGANITGTSDYLDTRSVLDLIFALKPDTAKVGLLYDVGQDSSATPIAEAKQYLESKNVTVIERTGTNAEEVTLAAQALVADGVDAVFTPTDNTIMKSELSIYTIFEEAGIPHFTGADSFALNGAFLGYGVDYVNLGENTADMIVSILVDGKDPATTPVMTFDNGTATVNEEVCASLGYDFATVSETFAPFCTKVQAIKTAESFS